MAKNRRKQKQSDETLVDLVEVGAKAQGFMDKYQNYIFGALVAGVVIFGAVFIYRNFVQAPRQVEATEQMFQAQVQFERDSFVLALTNPGGGYLGFLDIIDTYGGTPAGNLANYYAGISYLHLGKFEAAIEYLQDFKADGHIIPAVKFGALGDAYAELGDLEKGMSFYKKAANVENDEALTAYFLVKIGMLYEKQGQKDQAKTYYQKVKDEYPSTPDGQNIAKLLARVE